MIRAIQFCPDTAVLVPGVAGRDRPLDQLWQAVLDALRTELAGAHTIVLLAARAGATEQLPSWQLASIRPSDFSFGAAGVSEHWLAPEVRALTTPGQAGPDRFWPACHWPLSLSVAAAAACSAGWRDPCRALVVNGYLSAVQLDQAAKALRSELESANCGLLVAGSGSARVGERAPLAPVAGAREENDRLVDVLSHPTAANRAWLRALAPEVSQRCTITGASVWQIVERVAGPVHAGRVQWNDDLGVSYPAVTWTSQNSIGHDPGATTRRQPAPSQPGPASCATEDDAPIAIVGATATGKSDLALEIAERLGGQIINADAMQLYRGMDIGTAKVPLDQRRGIAHHMVDVLDLDQEASVAAYQRQVRALIADLRRGGIRPILAGGSGLYIRAVLDDLQFPATDPQVRARLQSEADERGPRAMHARLHDLDPVAAERIPAANVRRIVRALEVIELTGRPFSASMPEHRYAIRAHQFALEVPLAELDARIAHRTEAMLAAGWLAEARELADRGLASAPTASKAVGYRELLDVLAGRLDLDQAQAAIVAATTRLARRQLKWFRRDDRITWLAGGQDAGSLADQIVAALTPAT